MKNITLIGIMAALTAFSSYAGELTAKERSIVMLGSAVAKGEQDKLAEALKAGFAEGLTLNEAKELIGQLYAYCGFPRALNAAATLMKVAEEVKPEEGKEPSPFKDDYNALKDGTANQTKLCGGPVKGPLFDFHAQLDEYLKAHLFGDIFERDALDWRVREIVTIAALAACPETEPQMKAHIAVGKVNGVTDEQAEAIVAMARSKSEQPKSDKLFIVRIAEIEVYEQYLNDYLEAAAKVGSESVAREEGVVCIFPMQKKESPCLIRIVEIYRGAEAYKAHLETPHFKAYKEGTLHMVKSLNLAPMLPLDAEGMGLIFKKE